MSYKIVKVNKENYHLFDDMIFWRVNGFERNVSAEEDNTSNLIIPEEFEDKNLSVYAIKVDDKFIGWISMIILHKIGRPNFKGFLYVDELWVQENYRRKGYAEVLMSKADDLLMTSNLVGIRLGVNVINPGAKALYEKCGYESTGKAYTMEKRKRKN